MRTSKRQAIRNLSARIDKQNENIWTYNTKVDKLNTEVFGVGLFTLSASVPLKDKVEGFAKYIDKLEKRISELEKALQVSGIVEELDESEIVNINTNDGFFISNKQFIVNKVI